MSSARLLALVAALLSVVSGPVVAACIDPKIEPEEGYLKVVNVAANKVRTKADAEADGTKKNALRSQGEALRRQLLAGLVTRLLRAGLDRQALSVATHEKGLGVTSGSATAMRPAEAISALRALRFVANGFSEPGSPVTASGQLTFRLACLDEALNITTAVIQEVKGDIASKSKSDSNASIASVESGLTLLSLFYIERAEVLRDIGDITFRTIDPGKRDAGNDRFSGAKAIARERYRSARFAIANALAVAEPNLRARISLIAAELDQRVNWLRKNRAFSGRSYNAPTRPIGYDSSKDPLRFTILASLQANISKLKESTDEYDEYRRHARSRLVTDFTNYASAHGNAETYRQTRIQALFAELERLEIDAADLDIMRARQTHDDGSRLVDLKQRHALELKELDERRKAASLLVAERLSALSESLTELGTLGPLDAPKELVPSKDLKDINTEDRWKEDVALFRRLQGTCGAPLAPEERPVLNTSWSAVRTETFADARSWEPETLQELPNNLRAALSDAITQIGIADHPKNFETAFKRLDNAIHLLNSVGTGQSEDAALTRKWKVLIGKCWELGRQLQIERALLLNTRINLQSKHLRQLDELAVKEARLLRDGLISDLERGAFATRDEMLARLSAAQEKLYKAATKQIREKIAHAERLLEDAKKIVEKVIQTGENVERAASAAEAVYASMTAVPVGSGPGGVFFERETLVALQDSAVDLARFTYRATKDASDIKQQLLQFESKLKAYRDDLENLKIQRTIDDIDQALKAAGDDIKEGVQDILDETRAAMLGRVDKTAARLKLEATAALNSAIVLSDSRAALIETQLSQVTAELKDLTEERRSLRERQKHALRNFGIEVENAIDLAGQVKDILREKETARERQSVTLDELRKRQAKVMMRLRGKNASLASRAEEILEQVQRLRAGKGETPWSGAQKLALSFLAPAPSLDADALDRALRVRRALNAVGDDIFELAVAIKYLRQDETSLLFAVQPASVDEANRVYVKLRELYKSHIENSLRQRINLIALRITPEAASSWGKVPGPDGPVYPECLHQDTDGEIERCLRIVTTHTPIMRWNGLRSDDRPLAIVSPRCDTIWNAARVLEPTNTAPPDFRRGVDVLHPANGFIRETYEQSPALCPGKKVPPLAEPYRSGELIFSLSNLLRKKEKGVLLDTLVATSDPRANAPDLPADLKPIGTTQSVCSHGKDQDGIERYSVQVIERPFQSRYETSRGLKPSSRTLNPQDGVRELREADAQLSDIDPNAFYGVGALGRRQLFFGRGLTNTFELRVNNDVGVNSEIYVFLFVAYVNCDPASIQSTALATPTPAYKSSLDALLESKALRQAPTARRLLDIEIQLAAARTDRSARLDIMRKLLAAGASLPAATKGNALDRQAARTLTKSVGTYISSLASPLVTKLPQDRNALFRCALEGDPFCRLPISEGAAGEIATFASSGVDRPVPIGRYEEILNLTMDGDPGPLPSEVNRRADELDKVLVLLRRAIGFIDRSVSTQRTVLRLETLAERRMDFLGDAENLLKVVQQGPPAGLTEAACVDRFFSDPAFWALQAGGGQMKSKRRKLVLVRGFLNHCLGPNVVGAPSEQCSKLARLTDKAVVPDPLDLVCAKSLGLGTKAESLAAALARSRSILSTTKSGKK